MSPLFCRLITHFRAKLYLRTFTRKNPIVQYSLLLYLYIRLGNEDQIAYIKLNIHRLNLADCLTIGGLVMGGGIESTR